MDCQQWNNTCHEALATVTCDPGFPLTMRLHQDTVPDMMLDIAGVKIGHPVIDTTDSMGLICSRNTNQLAVNKICNMIGHKKVFPNYYTFCTFDT